MTDKMYNAVGITSNETMTKVRFANDMHRRVKQFAKGSSRCDFVELPTQMTKIDALNFMLTRPEFASPADQATISEALASRVTEPKVKVKPSLEVIKSRGKKQAATAQDVLDAVNS